MSDANNDAALQAYFDSEAGQAFDRRRGTTPYSGIRTLLRAPLVESFGGLDIALIGVPFDMGVTNRPGTRFGPQQVRAAGCSRLSSACNMRGSIPERRIL